jgi:hypothetical protein
MRIDKFSKYIFWSYKNKADLPESIIANNVILYGDIKDMVLLTELLDKEIIIKTIDRLSKLNRAKKRINFFKKVIL